MDKTDLEKSKATNKKISSNVTSNSKEIIEKANEHPEWLPEGWIVDFKIRKSGASMGAGYKCYIDPLNGYKFYSKPEVLRYLKTIKGDNCNSEEQKNSTLIHSPSNVAVEKSTVDDLPPGWTKEVRIKKNINGVRKDPFYIDPVNGYVFRSKKEALRYIESGDISRCLFKSNKRKFQEEDNSIPSSTAKRQKVNQSATKRQLFVGKVSEKSSIGLLDANSSKEGHDVTVSSALMIAPVPAVETAVKMHSLEDAAANPLEINSKSDRADVQEKNYVSNVMEDSDKKRHSSSSISKTKERLNVPHRFSRRLAGIDPNHAAALNATGEIGKINAQENKSGKKKDHIPCRASKRLAGFEPEIEITNSGKPPEYKGKNSRGGFSPESRQSEGMPVEELADHASTYISSPRNEESSRRSKKSKIPPRTSEQLEKFGDEQLNDEKSERQLSFAFHYSWSDPSVESAIKTLTGVLPVDTEPVLVSETHVVQKNKLSKSVDEGGDDKNPQDTSKKSKNTVDNQPILVPETDAVQKNKLSESVTEHSKDRTPHVTPKKSENTVDNGLVLVPQIDMVQTNKLSKSVAEGSNNKIPQIPRKSKNKKELSLPRRSSKRLSGHEPEVAPAERALEYSARKSCKDKLTASATSGNGASKHLDIGEETEFTLQASDCSKRKAHGDSSNDSEKSHEAQIVPNEKLLQVEAKKSELTLQASNCSKISVHGESYNKSEKSHEAQIDPNEQLQKVEAEKIELTHQASDCLKISEHKESLNKSEKSQVAQIVPNEQLQKVEAEKSNERSEPHLSLPFGDSWSDPCIEFAFKTLTGALPEEDSAAANISHVMTLDINGPPNKEFLGSVVEKCIADEAHDNLNQSQNSEDTKFTTRESYDDGANITKNLNEGESQHVGQPELCTSSTYCENSPKFAIRQSYSDEVNIMRDLFGESLPIESVDMACEPSNQLLGVPELKTSSTSCENIPNITKNLDEGESLRIEAGNKSQFVHQSRNIDSFVQEEPSNRFGKVLEEESAPTEQPQLQTQTQNQEKSELQFSAPLMDSWTSDPCLEFAFKTLTGALPIQENLAIPGYFQEPEKYRSQRDASSMLPDFGSPSFSQNDISFHYNVEKSPPGQHSSMSSSILPPEKVSLHRSIEPDSNKHYSQCSKNFQDR